MAFVQRLYSVVPSFGVPFVNDTLFLKAGTSLSGTAQQTTSLTSLTPTVTRGYVRAKVSAGGGTTPTLSQLIIQVTDGTTTTTIFTYNPSTALALSANIQADFTVPFCVDINVSQVNILTTMGGTSPTSTLDAEVSGVS